MPQLPITLYLGASALLGAITAGFLVTTLSLTPTELYLTPLRATTTTEETFTITLRVRANEPVNVFAGTLNFDPARVAVAQIDYNTSVADLWAEAPWYEKGGGTITFAGGSTRTGGFTGDDSLLSVTFRAINPGTATMQLNDIRILRHDGLGTDADVAPSIDSIVQVVETERNIARTDEVREAITILTPGISTDLNGDGSTNIIDVSMFMRFLTTQDMRADFNSDGAVTTSDLSILLNS